MWKTVKYFQLAIVFLQKLKWSSETTKKTGRNRKAKRIGNKINQNYDYD